MLCCNWAHLKAEPRELYLYRTSVRQTKGWLFWERGGICEQGCNTDSCRRRTEKAPLSPPDGAEQQKRWQLQPRRCSSHFFPLSSAEFWAQFNKTSLKVLPSSATGNGAGRDHVRGTETSRSTDLIASGPMSQLGKVTVLSELARLHSQLPSSEELIRTQSTQQTVPTAERAWRNPGARHMHLLNNSSRNPVSSWMNMFN